MGRNHKKVITESLQLASELGINISFDCLSSNGEFLKPYATAVTIDNKELQTIKGLQAWDNHTFRDCFMLALREYVTHEDLTGHEIRTIQDIEAYCKGSKTSADRVRNTKGESQVCYSKDSYKWSQIDLIDKFYDYIESIYDFDTDNNSDLTSQEVADSQKRFLINALKATIECNPSMRGWNALRLENYYITYKILPRFIKEHLQIDLDKENMNTLQRLYYNDWNPELFGMKLHELVGR